MSTGEKNKALVCRFLEAQSTGDLEALDKLLAPDFVDHGLPPSHDPGREGFMKGVAEAHAALSFIRTTIEYQGTDSDDMVITRHTTRTIHDRGAYLGLMTPTGQERETRSMLIHRVSRGKIVPRTITYEARRHHPLPRRTTDEPLYAMCMLSPACLDTRISPKNGHLADGAVLPSR